MHQKLSEWGFVRLFDDCGREDQFSIDARVTLFHFFEDISPEMVVDPVAICSDWDEMSSADIIQQYGETYELFDETLRRIANEFFALTVTPGTNYLIRE